MTGSATLHPHPFSPDEATANLELQRLAWAYCHAIDRGDLVLLRSLYHDDAIDDHGAMFCGTPDEYVAWLPRMLAGLEATRHTMHIILGGRFLDEYERRAGVWRILRRSLVLDTFEERRMRRTRCTHGCPCSGPLGCEAGRP